eukprot:NODE_27274_length_519_cov_1.831633.p3 GENE.NODE_27274_length_519_cov_1.831633~~NODE_27274_length_519_cov_1.831633.p3  ORF type:complete len:118 (+),score=27.16 NODE_27274_length_519_cov_1.831633:109-462(+)
MGNAPVARAEEVKASLRVAGNFINTHLRPKVSERTFAMPSQTPTRISLCRCWQSNKFPYCDNTHQKLQKLGVNVGPCMLELRPGPRPVKTATAAAAPKVGNLGPMREASAGSRGVPE